MAAAAALAATTTTTTTTEAAPLIGGKVEGQKDPEWAEYVVDPNKDDAANAAAKADHDKTKPATPAAKTEEVKVTPLTVADVKLPEGFTVDEPVMNEFLGVVNDSALTPAARAQALVDLQVKSFTQASERASSAWAELQTERQTEWANDATIGGAQQAIVAQTANDLIANFGSPELSNLIGESGVGNSIHFARFMAKIAPFLKEAAPVNGNTPAGGAIKPSPTNLYPDQGK